jgi:tetratricopeptide (TPR) repeat protein
MLEPIREFAAEKLVEAGEGTALRRAHAEWFLAFAERAAPKPLEPHAPHYVTLLEVERGNLRAALGWSGSDDGDPELHLRLAVSLSWLWQRVGRWSEGRAWLEPAISKAPDAPGRLRATGLYKAGALARWQSDLERARDLLDEALALYRRIGDRNGEAMTLLELSKCVQFLGDLDAAEALLREVSAIYEEIGDDTGRAEALGALGVLAYDRRDFDDVEAKLGEALAIYKKLGDRRRVAAQLYNLGTIALQRARYDESQALLEEALPIAREFGERPLVARIVHFLGSVSSGHGDYTRAAELRAKAAREYKALGDRHMLLSLLEDVALEAAQRGLLERAARLVGAMQRSRRDGELPHPSPGDDHEATVLDAARRALGEAHAERVVSEGQAITFDLLLDYALESPVDDGTLPRQVE